MLLNETHMEYLNIILFTLACLFPILIFVLYYHGVFYTVEVKVTKPPFNQDLSVFYKFTQIYSESRTLLSDVQALAPQLDSFSIYHQDFYTKNDIGSSIGVISNGKKEEKLYRKLMRAGYKKATFPTIDFAVVSSFPYRNQYSLTLAVHRIYPKLRQYIKANRLCAYPIMEFYTKDKVYFIAPLSKQLHFYAEEAKPDYEEYSTDAEDYICKDELECIKCHFHQNSLINPCYCDPLLNSSSYDRRKRAL